MRIAKIEKDSLNNGPGVRVVVWCQGCDVQCEGCHNKDTWDFNGGDNFKQYDMLEIMEELKKPHVQGITFSGGHPLAPQNIGDCIKIASMVCEKFPDKDIWLYTGYTITYKDFKNEPYFCGRQSGKRLATMLRLCDIIVDGPYIETERDISLKFRGSKNQRLIDVKKTLKNKKITLVEEQ